MNPQSYKTLILSLFLITGGVQSILSQNPTSYFYENEFDIAFPVKGNWSIEAGIGNRGLFAEVEQGNTKGYQHQQIEINHFTHYQSSESFVLSLGLRYRVRDIFDPSETNEFRIIEQLEIASANRILHLEHRFRLEQRFREQTVHRARYELAISRPINEIFSWAAATEALYGISAHLKPEAEQRFSLGLENTSFKNVELELTFQYRIEDYSRNLAHEFFIITGVSLELQSD